MIHFCFRDTEDWENKTPYQSGEVFWNYNPHRKRRYEFFKQYFDLWNKTQFVSYFQFRYELKELAKLSFQDSGIPEIKLENWRDLQDDDWIVPQDDDDWFCPNLKTAIKETEDDFVVGSILAYKTEQGMFQHRKCHQPRRIFPSCGHGFRIGMLNKYPDKRINKVLEHHGNVRRFIDKESIPYTVLNKVLACRVAHCGSASYMYRPWKLKRFVNNPQITFAKAVVPKNGLWCKKYVKKFMELADRFQSIKMI